MFLILCEKQDFCEKSKKPSSKHCKTVCFGSFVKNWTFDDIPPLLATNNAVPWEKNHPHRHHLPATDAPQTLQNPYKISGGCSPLGFSCAERSPHGLLGGRRSWCWWRCRRVLCLGLLLALWASVGDVGGVGAAVVRMGTAGRAKHGFPGSPKRLPNPRDSGQSQTPHHPGTFGGDP